MIFLVSLLLLLPQAASPLPVRSETPALVERLALAQGRHDEGAIGDALLELTDRLGTADVETLRIVIPEIVRATEDSEAQTRGLAMLALTVITGRPEADGLVLLEPDLGAIAKHLSDSSLQVRRVTVLVLGGFQKRPVEAAVEPLVASLKEADAPATTGPGAVYALLTLGLDDPAHGEIAAGILRFVHRADLPEGVLAKVIGAIANAPVHSEALDTGLLDFLGAGYPAATQGALVGVLPKLRLTDTVRDRTRATLTSMAADPKEDGAVRSAAAGVLPCWHAARMTEPCPALPMRYRMVTPPKKPAVVAPKYQSPPLS